MKRISRSEFLGFGAAIAGAGTAASTGLDLFAQGPVPLPPRPRQSNRTSSS